MKHWQQLNIDERLDVLAITSARTKLPQLVVEKDWWVTMVLKALSTTRYFSLMSFKGGTLHLFALSFEDRRHSGKQN